jgi:hypothetical protein
MSCQTRSRLASPRRRAQLTRILRPWCRMTPDEIIAELPPLELDDVSAALASLPMPSLIARYLFNPRRECATSAAMRSRSPRQRESKALDSDSRQMRCVGPHVRRERLSVLTRNECNQDHALARTTVQRPATRYEPRRASHAWHDHPLQPLPLLSLTREVYAERCERGVSGVGHGRIMP